VDESLLPLFRRFYGTLAYAPPEVLQGDAYRADLAEIWCLGVLFYTLLSGEPPFKSAEAAQTLSIPPPNHPISALSWSLLEGMLRKDPRQRISLEQITHALREESSS
jgi:serine/threonine protein kinase